jgi:hypothetical protein
MRGFGAMCLLRGSRCVDCVITSVRGLEMPVDECSCARGACPFLCPWSAWYFVYCTSAVCTTNLYNGTVGTYIKNDDHHERTKGDQVPLNEPRTKFLTFSVR